MYTPIGRYLKKRFCYPISVFITTACNTSSCFMSTPRCFPFANFVCFEFYSFSGKSHRWIRGSLKYYLGEPHIFFIFFYSYNKTIDDFGFQLIPRFINPRDLIITSADGLSDNQISGVDKSWY